MTDDAFVRVASLVRSSEQPVVAPLPTEPASRDPGEFVSSVPPAAPVVTFVHATFGAPSATWSYRTAEGAVVFHVARFDTADGGKEVRPRTLWRKGGKLTWHWKAPPTPRPLYGLPALAAKPAAPVLVVEGEKTAEAAARLFTKAVVVTWQGGGKAALKADWSRLAGRRVAVWPDADEAGRLAAEAVVSMVRRAGAASIAIVRLPPGLPAGWDLADTWPGGFDESVARTAFAMALAGEARADVVWSFGFRMEADGLFFDQHTPSGPVPQRLSGPFEVLALARDPQHGGWALVIRFEDPDGRRKTKIVPHAKLASGGGEVRGELAEAGLSISPARGKAERFVTALAEVGCSRRMILAETTGWCGESFVLPGEAISPQGGEPVLFTGDARSLCYGRKGSLVRWQAEVAAKAAGNDLLAFSLSLAFAGPLMHLLGAEGGGFHLRGPSSCGKTTLARAAGSVWGGGGPLGYGCTWRATGNALEGVAAGHCDSLLVLDELSLVAPEEAGAAAYALASGQAKGRAQTSGKLRARAEWRIMLLSTGEISLANHVAASQRPERVMAGQELRLLDIEAYGGADLGVWRELHGAESPAAFSDTLVAAASRDFGHAGPAFAARIVEDPEACRRYAEEIFTAFVKEALRAGDTGQAQRAASRFALVAAAGELARLWEIAHWPQGLASGAALALFRRWAEAFGRNRPREDREILRQVRDAIERDQAAFAPLREEDTTPEATPSEGGRGMEARSLRTLGYRQVVDGKIIYAFNNGGWRETLRGADPVQAAKVIRAAGYLVTDKGENRLKRSISIKGQKLRLHCVSADIVGAELGD